MTTFAIVLFVIALVTELVGIGLLIIESVHAARLLRDFLALNPLGNPGGSYAQAPMYQTVVVSLLGDRTRRWWAVGLIVVGVIAGFVGNLVSLGG